MKIKVHQFYKKMNFIMWQIKISSMLTQIHLEDALSSIMSKTWIEALYLLGWKVSMDLECNILVDHHSWELVPYQSNIILVDRSLHSSETQIILLLSL